MNKKKVGLIIAIGALIMCLIISLILVIELRNMIDNLFINSEDFQYFMRTGIVKIK